MCERIALEGSACSVMALVGNDGMCSLHDISKVIASLLCSSLIFHVLWSRYWGSERKSKSARKGTVQLPTPRRLLPNWFGFLSGHTLLLEAEKVRFLLISVP